MSGQPAFLNTYDRRPDNLPNTGYKFTGLSEYFRDDKDLFWRFKPNLNLIRYFKNTDEEIHFSTNNRGERGRLWDYAKPSDTVRIVILGDSSSAGFGLNDDEAYAERLQKKLDSYKPNRYQVVNLACYGYTSLQNCRILELDGSKYQPDIVVMSCGFNDMSRERVRPDSAYEYPSGIVSDVFFFLHESRFVRLLSWVLGGIRDLLGGSKVGMESLVPRVSVDEFKVNLLRTVDLARGMGAQIVFLPISAGEIYEQVVEEMAVKEKVPLLDFEAKAAEIYPDLEAEPVPAYDGVLVKRIFEPPGLEAAKTMMVPWRVEIRRKSYFFNDYCHPSNVGAVLIADLLYDFILKSLNPESS